MNYTDLYIDGVWKSGTENKRFDVINPADETVITSVASASVDDAKAAINALSKNLAKKLAPNVRVNVLAPGNVYFKGGSWDEKLQKDKDNIQNLLTNLSHSCYYVHIN